MECPALKFCQSQLAVVERRPLRQSSLGEQTFKYTVPETLKEQKSEEFPYPKSRNIGKSTTNIGGKSALQKSVKHG
ncbi:hypothetical protein NDU88_002668 [Pleurodeles waltl]|uniref:Uncharacterized protein n=1 Tax=Pleurodeles waltl TaxID=8319 RepID=A0AAV7NG31_PLEWA|nr:hypothetical protein NDU88_002668 [Pleurodeles waltl]